MKLERALLVGGAAIAAILLGRFAIDFGRWMPIWLAVPAWLLVLIRSSWNELRVTPRSQILSKPATLSSWRRRTGKR